MHNSTKIGINQKHEIEEMKQEIEEMKQEIDEITNEVVEKQKV